MTFQGKIRGKPLHIYITLHQALRPHMLPVLQPTLSCCTPFDAQDSPIGLMAGHFIGILAADLHNIHLRTKEYALQSEDKVIITISAGGAPIKRTYFVCGRLSLIATPNKWILLIIFPCVHQDGACRFKISLGHLTSMAISWNLEKRGKRVRKDPMPSISPRSPAQKT